MLAAVRVVGVTEAVEVAQEVHVRASCVSASTSASSLFPSSASSSTTSLHKSTLRIMRLSLLFSRRALSCHSPSEQAADTLAAESLPSAFSLLALSPAKVRAVG